MTDEEIIDAVIKEMYEAIPGHIELFSEIKRVSGITHGIEAHTIAFKINSKLVNAGIVTDEPNKGRYLTALGLEIIEKHNGYINFLTAKNLSDQKEVNRISKADKIQSNSLIISSWTKWTYWLGFIFEIGRAHV